MNSKAISDGLSLREIIDRFKELVRLLLVKWKTIALWSIIGGCLGIATSILYPKAYIAKSTFTVANGSSGGALSKYMQFFGQLGIGGGGGLVDEEKITLIIVSRRVIAQSLLKKRTIEVMVEGVPSASSDILANHFVDNLDLAEDWKDEDSIVPEDFRFLNTNVDSLTDMENRVMNMLYGRILKDIILVNKSFEGIIAVEVSTSNESLSQQFNEAVLESMNGFYVNKSVQREIETVNILGNRLDSVRIELSRAEDRLFEFMDRHLTTVKAQAKKDQQRLSRDVQILNVMYVEIVKNLELARFNLLDQTPVIQIIDRPIIPLGVDRIGKSKGIMIGIILGVLFSCLFLVARHLILENLQEE